MEITSRRLLLQPCGWFIKVNEEAFGGTKGRLGAN